MENTRIFHASKKKALLVLSASIAFVVVGASIIDQRPWIGWVCAGFFGLGIPVSLVMMLPNAMYLRLDESGFEMGSFFGSQKVRWNEVNDFTISPIKGVDMIAVAFSDAYTKQNAARAIAATISGIEFAIANSYDAPLTEVLESLNDWKSRYGG